MRILDRYLVAAFAKSFVSALIAFAVGVAALDYFGRMNQFSDPTKLEGSFAADYSNLRVVFQFYQYYLPYLLKEVMPFVTVTAGLLTIVSLLRNNEILPVIAAGTSVRRLLAPVLLCGLCVSLSLVSFQELLVPSLNREHMRFKRLFTGHRDAEIRDVPHLRDGKGTVTRVGSYVLFTADQPDSPPSLNEVVIQRPWREHGFETWIAPVLVGRGEGWVATEGVQVLPADPAEPPRVLPAGTPVEFGVTPEDVDTLISKKGTSELSYRQLKSLAEKFPDRRSLQVAVHRQIAQPFGCFVLLLAIVPVLLKAGRSVALGGGTVLVLSGGFFFLTVFCTILGDRGELPPMIAAYLPVALYLSLGVARLTDVPT